MNDAVHAFLSAVQAELGAAPEASRVVPGGPIVRFSTNGERGDDSGWCRLFLDERGGVYGCWRSGAEQVWQAPGTSTLTAVERQLRAREIERSRTQRAAADAERNDRAAAGAQAIWDGAVPFIRHGYTDRKRIPPAGLRLYVADGRRSPFFVTGNDGQVERLRGPLIVVPMCDAERRLWSLQAIDDAGRKSFLRGGRTGGTFYVIARERFRGVDLATFSGEVGIAEGLATGAAVHALSAMPVFVGFSASNLTRVALAARARLPRAQIIVAGDVDRSGAGQRAAEAAAAAVGGLVSLPPFTDDELASGLTDWNDWAGAHRDEPDRMVG